MRIIRNLVHFEHSPCQLVAVPFHNVGVEEIIEGHPAAMVGRPDAEGCGHARHAHLILSVEGGPEGLAVGHYATLVAWK
jgi:hypothetical protein